MPQMTSGKATFNKVGWAMLTPIATLVTAGSLAAIILLALGNNPIDAAQEMWASALRQDSIVSILNRATPLYLAAIAVAIGFRMNLFNIGVEGQYVLAGLVAAQVGAQINLWAPLHVLVIVLTAMAVGMAWVAVPAVLKITRGVHEVISTIMMNAISVSFVAAYLFNRWDDSDGLITRTKIIPESGRVPDLNNVVELVSRDIDETVIPAREVTLETGETVLRPEVVMDNYHLWGFLGVAILIGLIYHYFINRTRPGFDIRSVGVNPMASEFAGIDPKRTILIAMLMSGAVAGLVGLPEILGDEYSYSLRFTQDLGFAGIAVALVGQNHAVGVALAAVLFGMLDTTGPILDREGFAPEEIVTIIKGVMIFSAIVVFVIARRKQLESQAKIASQAVASEVGDEGGGEVGNERTTEGAT